VNAATRFAALLVAVPLAACATAQGPTRAEVDGLRAQVAELRAQHVRTENELSLLRTAVQAQPVSQVTAAPAARAEATTTTADLGPQVPENLAVVYVTPEPTVITNAPGRRAPRPRAVSGPPTPLPTETALREPVNPDADPAAPPPSPDALSPAGLEVAYQAALAAPGPGALERFAREHPQAAQADNALFEAGIHAERNNQAEHAAADFARMIREHPASDVVADALLHLAACQLDLHHPRDARATLTQITHQFAGSAQAEAARARLADLAQ